MKRAEKDQEETRWKRKLKWMNKKNYGGGSNAELTNVPYGRPRGSN